MNKFTYKLMLAILMMASVAQAQVKVFNNNRIRVGNGSENSINTAGNMQQPFYYNGSSWQKLTYSVYPLDILWAVGGDGTSNWNTNGTLVENPTIQNQVFDYTGFVTTSGNNGYGVIKSTGNITVGTQTLLVENTYTLGQNDGFIKIKVKVTNISGATASNVRVWVGTRDDYVGGSDGPTKERGNIVNDAFQVISTAATQSKAIKIFTSQEAILFYSNSSRANTSINSCCSFSNAYYQSPSTSSVSATGDGSYAMYVRFNDLAQNQSDELEWFYAAGTIAEINNIISSVAQASSAVSSITQTSAVLTASSSTNATGYWMVVPNGSAAPTAAQIEAGVNYGSVSVVSSGSGAMTASVARTFNLTGLTANTTYTVYFVAKDGSNQYSSIANSNFTTSPLSNNADLSALSLSSGTISPTFAAATTSYSATVPYTTSSITVTPTLSDNNATQKVNNVTVANATASSAINLNVGTNTINVVVTAQNGVATKTYTINITRNDMPPASLVYTPDSVVAAQGVTSISASPSSTGGSVVSYSISPALPSGLLFNTSTGAITGTPTTYQSLTTYTITATNSGGSTTGQFKLRINSLPTTGVILNPSVCQNSVNNVLNFTVADIESAANTITVAATSSNTTLLANTDLVLGGSGANRTLTYTPANGQYGSSTITLTLNDGTHANTVNFTITVTPIRLIPSAAAPTASPNTAAVFVDSLLVVNASEVYDGARVSITQQFTSGDALTASYLPSGVTSSYDAQRGILSISGTAISVANMQAILRGVKFSTTSNNLADRTINFTLGLTIPSTNNHYYEYVSVGTALTWAQAKTAAEARSLFGMQGYLATITSATENEFIRTKLTGDGWIGGSDEYATINAAVGYTMYANQTASEGRWHWITGPERGQLFSVGNTPNTVVQSGMYANWAPGEPNNCCVGEHFAQYYANNNGRWNDLQASSTLTGYVVEYGGMSSDPCISISADKVMKVNTPPTIQSITGIVNACPADSSLATVTFGDVEDASSTLTLTAQSSNTSLVPNTNLVFTGTTSPRTLTIKPINGVYGTATITVTVTDSRSATATTSFTYRQYADTTNPVAITKPVTKYLNASGTVSLTASEVNNNSTDNCGIQSLSISKTSFDCTNVGNNTVSLTVTDKYGNTNSANATVAIVDTVKPTVLVKSNVVVYLNNNGTASITTSMINNGSSDICGVASLAVSPTTVNCNDIGVTPIALTVTDVNGNAKTDTAYVIVLDPVLPTIRAKAKYTTYLNATGQATITAEQIDSASFDNCAIASRSINKSVFTCANIGMNTVVFTVIDQSGNSRNANVNVEVLDTVRPTLYVANNISTYLNQAGTATLSVNQVDLNSTDNCGISTRTINPTSFTNSQVGTNQIIFTVTDVNGNSNQRTVNVTVLDTVRPQAIAQNKTIYLNASGTASITVANINNGSSDNVGISNVSLSKTNFDCSNIGTNQVVLSVTDASNNLGTATSTVTVLDTIKPVALAKNVTVYLNSIGVAEITSSLIDNGSNDNCGVHEMSVSKTAFSCNDRGQNTVTLTVKDITANTSMVNAVITVVDTIAPHVIINNNLNVYLDNQGLGSLSVPQVNNGSTDNCAISTMVLGQTSFNGSHLGQNKVVFTVTDLSGNTSSKTIDVIVLDTIKPIVRTKAASIYLSATGSAQLSVAQTNNLSTDNVGITALWLAKTNFSCNDLGVNTILLMASDTSGNMASAEVEVTVLDTIAPMFTQVPADMHVGFCKAQISYELKSTDNCSNLTVNQIAGLPSGSVFPVGVTTNKFVVSDASGNTDTASFKITVSGRYIDMLPTNFEICANATPVDLSKGTANIKFFGTGISLDELTFDPALAGNGNHLVEYTFTDSMGCDNSGKFFVTVNPAPTKPIIDRINSSVLRVSTDYATYQWYRYEDAISNATAQQYTMTRSGIYKVLVGTTKGCKVMSDPLAIGVPATGLLEVDGNALFNVYPNPTTSQFVIELSGSLRGSTTVVIIDMLGKEVYRAVTEETLLNMDALNMAAGTYYVRVQNGDYNSVKPIVIKK